MSFNFFKKLFCKSGRQPELVVLSNPKSENSPIAQPRIEALQKLNLSEVERRLETISGDNWATCKVVLDRLISNHVRGSVNEWIEKTRRERLDGDTELHLLANAIGMDRNHLTDAAEALGYTYKLESTPPWGDSEIR